MSGSVFIDTKIIDKPGQKVLKNSNIVLKKKVKMINGFQEEVIN